MLMYILGNKTQEAQSHNSVLVEPRYGFVWEFIVRLIKVDNAHKQQFKSTYLPITTDSY